MSVPASIVASYELHIDTQPARLKGYERKTQAEAGRQLVELLSKLNEPRYVAAHTNRVKASNTYDGREYWDIRTIVLVSETRLDANLSTYEEEN